VAVVNLIIDLWILYNEGNFVTSITSSGCLMKGGMGFMEEVMDRRYGRTGPPLVRGLPYQLEMVTDMLNCVVPSLCFC